MTIGNNSGGQDGSGGFIDITQQENCRVAYTLNNEQPVRCSIIGDQPLFFMDFEGDLEDEFADEADPFGIEMIEQGVEALRHKILSAQVGASGSAEISQQRLGEMLEEKQFIFTSDPDLSHKNDLRIRSIEKTIRASRLGAAYLDMAQAENIKMTFNVQVEMSFYDREAGEIHLHPGRDDTDLVLLAVRELRRAWQHKAGALINPLTFQPDHAILVNRAQKADLCVSMLRAAWEMQLGGVQAPWARLVNSSLSDLTAALAREAYIDFRTLNNGEAACAVFEAWFLSDRCRSEDRALIQNMLSDYQGYVFDNEQSSRAISADLMMALGSMPFGKNYLAPVMHTVLSDPLFGEIRDRSNANFLWFIKFERSFRDAEQELQTQSPIQGHANPHDSIIKKSRLDGDHENNSTVIALPGNATKAPVPAKRRKGKRLSAGKQARDKGNIISFPARVGKG